MGWISNVLAFYRKEKPHYEEDIHPGKSRFLGAKEGPFTLTVDIESPPTGNGVILWGYSNLWTGCRGGSGFEFALSTSRLKVIGLDGKLLQEQRFSLPWWGLAYSIRVDYLPDQMGICFFTAKNTVGIRMMVLETMPDRINMGVGWPPSPLIGFKGAAFKNLRIIQL